MYKVRCSLPENREPWNIPLEQRMQILSLARKQGIFYCITFVKYHAANPFCCYGCCHTYQSKN